MLDDYDVIRKVCEEYGILFIEMATMTFDGGLEIELAGWEETVLPYDAFLKIKGDLGLRHLRISYHLNSYSNRDEPSFSWHYEKTGI